MPNPLMPLMPGLSPAVADLGMGGQLRDQVSDETEETRRKRMEQMKFNQVMGPQQSLAAQTIFGNAGY